MKICPACKNKFEKGNYCKYCGTKLTDIKTILVCSQCGRNIDPDWTFCPECGEKLHSRCLIIKLPKQDSAQELDGYDYELKELKKLSQDNPAVQREIGIGFARGYWGQEDHEEAIKWLLSASRAGDAAAMVSLAIHYMDGIGCSEDKKGAFNWLKEAAQLGYVDAIIRLGSCYMLGRGCKADLRFGQKLYNTANSWRLQGKTWCDNDTVIGG